MGAATAAFVNSRLTEAHSHLHANGQLLAGREPHGRGVPKGSSSTNRVQLSRWQRGTPSANKNGRGSHAHITLTRARRWLRSVFRALMRFPSCGGVGRCRRMAHSTWSTKVLP